YRNLTPVDNQNFLKRPLTSHALLPLVLICVLPDGVYHYRVIARGLLVGCRGPMPFHPLFLGQRSRVRSSAQFFFERGPGPSHTPNDPPGPAMACTQSEVMAR